ncbi:MAG: DMT family transporter [Lachnospiraceae bacterium]|nr:DMT family transporter [Lachnospiraceae bacterium]
MKNPAAERNAAAAAPLKNKNRGILYVLLEAFFFALMTFFLKEAGNLPTMEKALFRNLVASVVSLIILLRTEEKLKIKKGSLPFLILRAAGGTAGLICNFYAVDHLLISDANMLNKMSPFFAVLFSVFILKEKAGKFDWVCVALAFTGALIVIRPGFSMAAGPAFIGLCGGLGAGLAYTFVRLLGVRGERGPVIVFFFSAVSTLFTLPFAAAQFRPMTVRQFLCLLATGFSAMGGQLCVTKAYTYAPAKEISVFDYSQVIFAALLGALFLGEYPDGVSFLGYAVIIGAAVLRWHVTNHREERPA